MQLEEKLSIIEAVLFAYGEPIEPAKLAGACGVDESEIARMVAALNAELSDGGSALTVLSVGGSYQLATKQEYAEYIRAAMDTKRSAALSSAAMEVLTIIAYNQPVTRNFVDDVRGVDSGGVINNLIEKQLIEEAGRLDIPGKPVLFRTTPNFLRCFSLSDISELPALPTEYSQLSFEDFSHSEQHD